jgi:glutamate:GABA antiporter
VFELFTLGTLAALGLLGAVGYVRAKAVRTERSVADPQFVSAAETP